MGKRIQYCAVVLSVLVMYPVRADFKTTYTNAITFIQRLEQQVMTVLSDDKQRSFSLRYLVSNIPPLNGVKFPDSINKMLDIVQLQVPHVMVTDTGYEVTWENAVVLGKQFKLPVRLYIGPGKDGGDGGLSLSVGITGKNTLNTLLPELKQKLAQLEEKSLPENIKKALKSAHMTVEDLSKIVDWIEFETVGLIVSTKFVDPLWGELYSGVNVQALVRLTGPLENVTKFFGTDLTTLRMTGNLSPDLTGSEIRGELPGKFTLMRIPLDHKQPALFAIQTGGVQLRIGLSGDGALTIKGIGTFDIQFPFQKNYIAFNGSLDVMPLTPVGPAIEFAAWMDGMMYNMFGLPGLDVGNLGLALTFSLVSILELGAPSSVSGKGEIHIGPLTRDALIACDTAKSQYAVIVHAGALTKDNVIEYLVHVTDAAAQLIKKKVDCTALKNLFMQTLPPFNCKDCEFYFVPTESEIFDEWYTQGLHIKGGIEIFDIGGDIELNASMYSGVIPAFKASAYLKEIKIPKNNPAIIISGSGKNMKRGDADDGPVFMVELSPERQMVYMDGFLKIPVLDISSDTRFSWKLNSMECDVHHKLGGLFESDLHLRTDLMSVDAFEVHGKIDQQGLGFIGNLLQQEAQKFATKAQADLATALNNVKVWEQQARMNIDTWITLQVINVDRDINALLAKIHAADTRCRTSDFWHLLPNCAEEVFVPGYWVGVGVLQVHKEVTLKGVARDIARLGVGAASLGAQIGIKTAQAGVEFARATTDFTGKLLAHGFNITRVTFDGSMKELLDQGTLPKVEVIGMIFGKPFHQTYQVNFKNAQQLPAQIIAGLVQVFGPQPKPYKPGIVR
jgi:hypothetical protein